jgi:uncharacterized membrane protein YbhN (UPF0104 family)
MKRMMLGVPDKSAGGLMALPDEEKKSEPSEATHRRGGAVEALPINAAPSKHWLRILGLVFSVGILALSVFVLVRTVANVNWSDLRSAFAATGWDQIALAGLLTVVSYLTLTGYDALALRQLSLRVPYRITALGSFTSYAISFTLGFPLITAGTVRYWIYSQCGVTAGKVASLTLIAGVTFWLGMGLVIGVALVVEPSSIAEINRLKVWVNLLIGLGVLIFIAAYLFYVSRARRRIRIRGLTLELPGFRLTMAQMVLGVIDLCAAASVLFVLLPAGHAMQFIDFLAVYVFGCLLGIASHIPGGIGPFEMTMLKSVTTPTQEGLLASLLLFRAIYFIIPFILALAMIGAREAMRRWTALREAMERAEEDDASGRQ